MGKDVGNFFIISPTAINIFYKAVHIYRIGKDGKMAELRTIRCDVTFMMELGVISPLSIILDRSLNLLPPVTNLVIIATASLSLLPSVSTIATTVQ